MNLIYEKWNEILEYMRADLDMTSLSYDTWIKPLKIHSIEKNTLRILVEMDGAVEYLEKKYKIALQASIIDVINQIYEIEFLTKQQADSEDFSKKESSILMNETIERANLNPKYTFDTFVVGSNNKFAHAASLAVADKPGQIYNPLFLYGGVGLGKTHLMHSIAHSILKKDKNKKVLYVTSEIFTNELIDAIRGINNTTINDFREKYRNIDVLLIDDVQFIIGKESTQEEFFHTFNTLHGANKQIIISSDRPPKEIETLESRLRSRFEWGLIADISAPDYETRMAILRKKEETDGYKIDDEVIKFIASNVKSNIRELEGALNKLVAYSNLEKKEINVSLAEEVLRDILLPDEKKEVTPELIIQTVAEHYGITMADISGNKRNNEIVVPRQISMYLCRKMTDASLKNIGALLGKRDHTTIINGQKKIEEELKSNNTSLKNNIDIIMKKISPM
ncbi:MAG: chromosomal replication initiator protein DnaA [Methanobrevibacter sp.]|nr:chromosomal replication initiator protein DnaA [Methanobrevibacter sp.]